MNGTVDSALRAASRPLLRLVMRPAVRGSVWFKALQQIILPTPQEAIIADAMAYVAGSRLPGSYVEFGVAGGSMFATAFHAAQRNGLSLMRFYGFDSFQGMPAQAGPDSHLAGDQHQEGAFRADLAEFHQRMCVNGVDASRIDVIPGWFDDVLNDATKRKLDDLTRAAVVAADCGSYEATLAALRFVTSYTQDGMLLLFGDWFSYRGAPHHGQQRAFAEWLAAHPGWTGTPFQRFGWHGQSFIIHAVGHSN